MLLFSDFLNIKFNKESLKTNGLTCLSNMGRYSSLPIPVINYCDFAGPGSLTPPTEKMTGRDRKFPI